MKKCTKCQEEYPIEHFAKKGSGRSTRCSRCVAEYFRNYYHNNPERKAKHQARVAARKIARPNADRAAKYGITEKELDKLLTENGGLCFICSLSPIEHVDHCHLTGKVRGGLCRSCNHGLGNFKDDVKVLSKAIEYLRGGIPSL